ncbi:MAG: DUF4238 domain-containing protein, partial [Phaeodactylibacter sp.]|nr:DUF4238 domain-containing protein [Phaeodactylibacter sp.]
MNKALLPTPPNARPQAKPKGEADRSATVRHNKKKKTMHQHYVPRIYLKNFGLKKKNEFFVNVYNVNDKTNFTANIKNICG